RPPVLTRELLDRLADGRVVDDRHHLGEVIPEHFVVQDLVAIVKLLHVYVLGEVGPLRLVLPVGQLRLLLEGQHPRGQPAGERDAAVDERILQHRRSGRDAARVFGHDSSVSLDQGLMWTLRLVQSAMARYPSGTPSRSVTRSKT